MNAENKITQFAADLLEDDAHATGRSTLKQELLDMESGLKQKMDAGVSPDEAKQMETIRQALDAAGMIVDKIWESKYN